MKPALTNSSTASYARRKEMLQRLATLTIEGQHVRFRPV
jgi:hypothetical protein